MNFDFYIHSSFYEMPQWMRWENMPEYDAPVPFECIKDQIWKVRKMRGFCGEPIKDRSTYCELHAKHFRKPKLKGVRRR